MARSTDDFTHAPQQSITGVSSQESGVDGLSSNMKHICHVVCEENTHPVEEKSSFVKPIIKEEEDLEKFKVPGRFPGRVEPGLSLKSCDEEEFFEEPIEGQLSQPKSPPSLVMQKTKREFGAASYTDAHVDTVKEKSTIARMEGGNGKMHCKQGKGRKWKLFLGVCLVTCLLPVNMLFAAGDPLPISVPGPKEQTNNDEPAKCFTCNDMERCPNLSKIFGDDEKVYEKRIETPFPLCSGSPELASKKCIVCRHQEKIHIFCSPKISSIEAEDNRSFDLGKIENITEGCDPLPISGAELNKQTNNDSDPVPTSYSGLNKQTNNDVFPVIWVFGFVGFYLWDN